MAVRSRKAPGGGRILEIPASRIVKWVHGFDRRHSIASTTLSRGYWGLTGDDGADARISWALTDSIPNEWHVDSLNWEETAGLLAEHAIQHRVVAVLLARRRAFSVGVFDGHRLIKSKTDSSYVQGKTKAGGWSQKRYARRREGQARQARSKAAEAALAVVGERAGHLTALVTGGDRSAVDTILADPALASIANKRSILHLADIGEPKKAVLNSCADRINGFMVHIDE